MDADRLAPQFRRVVDAAGTLDDRLLVLLFIRKAEPGGELVEILGTERAETMAALGRLTQAGLVTHHRPEGEPIHWFATPAGRTRGEQLFRATGARLVAAAREEAAAHEPEQEPAAEPAETAAPDRERLKARRRIAIDPNEKTGFSWDR